MHIESIQIKNFRLLKDTTLNLQKGLSLIIGRNNTGKTSLLAIFDKFYNNKAFDFNDFSLSIRNNLYKINKDTDVYELAIRMILEIKYNDKDNLEYLSDFIIDLDSAQKYVKILFECVIDKDKLINKLSKMETGEEKQVYIEKNISKYLCTQIYAFEKEEDFKVENRNNLIKKELQSFKDVVNLEIIHANRNLSSSEAGNNKKILSTLTTKYFNSCNKDDSSKFDSINKLMNEIDESLNKEYSVFFNDFLNLAVDFLDLPIIKVISNIKVNEILADTSKVIYGSVDNHLPENLNGLGFMNILFLLLIIEIKKEKFKNDKKSLNLLLIEEPEVHTHPQMQYIFADKIQDLFKPEKNEGLAIQGLISTHSPYIVSKSDFKDIRYMKKIKIKEAGECENIEIKNFCLELGKKYKNRQDEFKFLTQYLTIQSAELFFACKIIFIEGTTERILLPHFINKIDKENESENTYRPLSSQNISVLEVGANAKAFDEFLKFFDIKTLIITDIDTTKKTITEKEGRQKTSYNSSEVKNSTHTSNETLKNFLTAPEVSSDKWISWFNDLKNHTLRTNNSNLKLAYQKLEQEYHARSFEDAFINANFDLIKSNKSDLHGLKNAEKLDTFNRTSDNLLNLTKDIIDKKSDFASSLLYLALSKNTDFQIPLYIKEGLEWLAKD